MSTVRDEAAKTKLRYLERLIGSALNEGVAGDVIDQYLIEQGVKDADIWRARVCARTDAAHPAFVSGARGAAPGGAGSRTAACAQ